MRSTMTIAALLLGCACTTIHAQDTLDARLRRAEAQRQTDEAKAKADEALRLAQERASRPGATARTGTPTVTINPEQARALVGNQPTQAPVAPVAPPPAPERFEILQLSGFLDDPQTMEAWVIYNGRRFAVSLSQRELADGWNVTRIQSDAVEFSRGLVKRMVRFVPAAASTNSSGAASAPTQGLGR